MHSIYGDPNHREPLLLSANHPMFCVFSVVFSSDGREIFCGGNDGCLYIYDRGSQNCSKVSFLIVLKFFSKIPKQLIIKMIDR